MKKVLRYFTLIALFSAISFPAYGGTWLRPGVTYTFYGGQPGNRGAVINASVKEVRNYVYEAKVDGLLVKGQWLGYCHPVYNPDEPRWCYFKPDGKEALDWTMIDGNWYNFGGGGTMLTGWHRTDGNYYYFDPVTGIVQTSGTAVRNGVTYEFQSDGLSKKIDGLLDAGVGGTDGWVEENGKHYYLRNGQRVINEWLQDGDTRYYVGEDGAMYTSGHIIDGFFYMFDGTGKLMTGGFSYSNGVKYAFDGTGRGIPVEMDAEERMYHSASTIWCEMTYDIYARDVQMYFWEVRDREKILAGLEDQWGVTSREECIATINHLFESGKATQDKSVKAWDFSRAMMLCESGYWAGWWKFPEQMDMQIAMAPTIQQSFSSWQEYQACYMDGFSNWSGGSGATYEKRKSVYDNYVQHGSLYKIDWNIKIEKTW